MAEPGKKKTLKKDIFDVLIEDHNHHRELLKRIEATVGNSEERVSLFKEFTLEAKGHAAAEEQALYSTLMARPDTTDEARHAVAEHHALEERLNELAETDMATGGWLLKFRSFREDYEHHLDEEEEDIFPIAEEELSDADEQRMRKIFETRKPKEKTAATVGGETRD
ncbi:MAG TPA: hemerythrin domain-containing protein [Candidatus Competibacter sp.]|nr:hemerythrin domain-containing protein [Candidatus Competibacter sp.]